jgi:hypothetical protein
LRNRFGTTFPLFTGIISLQIGLFQPALSNYAPIETAVRVALGAQMDSRNVARKAFTLIALVAVSSCILFIAPEGVRLFFALLALPLETFMLASLLGGSSGRHVPQP